MAPSIHPTERNHDCFPRRRSSLIEAVLQMKEAAGDGEEKASDPWRRYLEETLPPGIGHGCRWGRP